MLKDSNRHLETVIESLKEESFRLRCLLFGKKSERCKIGELDIKEEQKPAEPNPAEEKP